MDHFLELSLIIGIATGIALIMQYLKQPLILGHILTGILVGPAVLNLIQSREMLDIFSNLGITALLFIVGLSLSPRVMREVGRVSLFAGIGQVLFTTVVGYGIGLIFGFSPIVSVYLAFAFTFSSTIIISKLLSDKKDTHKLYGKISIGMLLVQDIIATIALLLVTATINGGGAMNAFFILIAKMVVIGGLLYLVSAFFLPKLTQTFAQSQEFLFLFSIGWGVGIAALFRICGLSVELGALAAGVSLASSPYHYEISSKMKILRDFFIVMFFVLLGSDLTLGNITMFLWPIIFYSLFILIGNPLIVMIILGVMGYTKKTSFFTGLTVAQISEFSLILLMLAAKAGQLPEGYLALATIVGMITISGSAILILHAESIYNVLAPALTIFERKKTIPDKEKQETFSTVLFGCHRVGSDFLPSIQKKQSSFLIVDFDPQVIAQLKSKGIFARYGDASDDDFLETLRFERAKLVISTIPDFETNALLLDRYRKLNQKGVIILIAQHVYEAQQLYQDGASYVMMPHHMGGNYVSMLVSKYGADRQVFEIEKMKHLKHLSERHAFIQSGTLLNG
jgi:Kef-type K+ transport system membrane component KefB